MIISGDIGPLSELGQGDGDNVPLYRRGAELEARREQEVQEVQGEFMSRLREIEGRQILWESFTDWFFIITIHQFGMNFLLSSWSQFGFFQNNTWNLHKMSGDKKNVGLVILFCAPFISEVKPQDEFKFVGWI